MREPLALQSIIFIWCCLFTGAMYAVRRVLVAGRCVAGEAWGRITALFKTESLCTRTQQWVTNNSLQLRSPALTTSRARNTLEQLQRMQPGMAHAGSLNLRIPASGLGEAANPICKGLRVACHARMQPSSWAPLCVPLRPHCIRHLRRDPAGRSRASSSTPLKIAATQSHSLITLDQPAHPSYTCLCCTGVTARSPQSRTGAQRRGGRLQPLGARLPAPR